MMHLLRHGDDLSSCGFKPFRMIYPRGEDLINHITSKGLVEINLIKEHVTELRL